MGGHFDKKVQSIFDHWLLAIACYAMHGATISYVSYLMFFFFNHTKRFN